jgi:hypothetical protein
MHDTRVAASLDAIACTLSEQSSVSFDSRATLGNSSPKLYHRCRKIFAKARELDHSTSFGVHATSRNSQPERWQHSPSCRCISTSSITFKIDPLQPVIFDTTTALQSAYESASSWTIKLSHPEKRPRHSTGLRVTFGCIAEQVASTIKCPPRSCHILHQHASHIIQYR